MSKHLTHKFPDDGKLSEPEAQKLLGVLCVKYGFCLPPLWHARLKRNPPRSIDKFLETVFGAEGLDPIAADGGMYNASFPSLQVSTTWRFRGRRMTVQSLVLETRDMSHDVLRVIDAVEGVFRKDRAIRTVTRHDNYPF